MSWATLLLAIVQLCSSLLELRRKSVALTVAQEAVANQQAIRLLELSQKGQELRARLDLLSDPEAQLLWDRMLSNAK